jgi:hypothetical protein
MKTKKQKNTVATIEQPEVGAIEIKVEPQTNEQAPVTVEVKTPARKAKKVSAEKSAGDKKETKDKSQAAGDARETEEKPTAGNQVKMPAPLQVDEQKLSLKIQTMRQKLEEQKRETTKSPVHVQYGFFLARAKSGRILALEFHESLKPNKWIARDLETKEVLSDGKTMHSLHEEMVREF